MLNRGFVNIQPRDFLGPCWMMQWDTRLAIGLVGFRISKISISCQIFAEFSKSNASNLESNAYLIDAESSSAVPSIHLCIHD